MQTLISAVMSGCSSGHQFCDTIIGVSSVECCDNLPGTLREVFKEHGREVAAALEAYQRARIEPTSQEVSRALSCPLTVTVPLCYELILKYQEYFR